MCLTFGLVEDANRTNGQFTQSNPSLNQMKQNDTFLTYYFRRHTVFHMCVLFVNPLFYLFLFCLFFSILEYAAWWTNAVWCYTWENKPEQCDVPFCHNS